MSEAKARLITADGRRYLNRTPRSVRAGKVVVHNHVHPARSLGMNGLAQGVPVLLKVRDRLTTSAPQ
jgi:hypothetical protein